MTLHEVLYTIANIIVLPFWVLIIILPQRPITLRLLRSWWPILVVAALYVISLVASFFTNEPIALAFDLLGIARLLGTPQGAATGWIHFLAFDLFVGRWAYLDSREKGLNPSLVSPSLLFILLAGPLGLLLYLGVRGISARS